MAGSVENRMKDLRVELEGFSKQDLIERVIALEKHVIQLKNVIRKSDDPERPGKRKKGRPFDFSKCSKRHILLKFYYLGWDYQGFATQEDTTETIEHHLFKALTTTCLIQDRESSNYNRCGRTDKGVSAFEQVISLDVRSSLNPGETSLEKEIQYCTLLNRVLPPQIRCVSWRPSRNPHFSARFDCSFRVYRYFFPKGNLSLPLMLEAAQFLVGVHDFRNLCKMDVNNGVTNFVRNISKVEIFPVDSEAPESGFKMYFIQIEASAFLWHQIRCIVAVLFMVGQELERPEIIRDLLDIEATPRKPNFQMASHLPLNLYQANFKSRAEKRPEDEPDSSEDDLGDWIYDKYNLDLVIESLQGQWCLENVKATMIKSMLEDLERLQREKFGGNSSLGLQMEVLKDLKGSKVHQPLMLRQKCQALDERIRNLEAKRRKIK